VDGDSLEAALRDYGPAAIEDLLPRLRTIAITLDAAHATGQAHGSLHPQNIFVSAESTHVTGLDAGAESLIRLPYSAPEMVSGGPAVAASDQFALAAITFEWLFGRRITGPAVRPIEVRALPGVDRDAMAQAFTRALAPQAADRFASCAAFCAALEAAVIPVLPLGGVAEDDVLETEFLSEAVADLAAFEPALAPEAFDKPEGLSPRIPEGLSPRIDKPEGLSPRIPEGLSPRIDKPEGLSPRIPEGLSPRIRDGLSPPVEPVTSWQPSASYTPAKTAERFSGGMLIVSCLVGMVVGFAAGYMAKPRALQSGPLAASRAGGAGEAGRAGGVGTEGAIQPDLPASPALPAQPARPAVKAPPAQAAARPRAAVAGRSTTASTGTLVVESRPAGASVVIDGKPRGTTPLTVEAMAPGNYRVNLLLAGYQPFATTVRVVAGERTRAAASLSVQE